MGEELAFGAAGISGLSFDVPGLGSAGLFARVSPGPKPAAFSEMGGTFWPAGLAG